MSVFPRKGVRNRDGSRKKPADDAHSAKSSHSSLGSERGAAKQQGFSFSFAGLKGLHRQMAADAVSRVIGAPVSTVLNSLMIAVAFSLPALLYLLVINLQMLGNGWDGQPRVSLYLSASLERSHIERFRAEVNSDPEVESIRYISPDDGLNAFQAQTDMKGVVGALGFNPLPAVIEVQPVAGLSYEMLDKLADRYQGKKEVTEARLDREWVQRLYSIVSLLEKLALMLSVLMGIAVLLTIGNTVRVGIESRKAEIRVIKLVGGTDGFIMLPFLYMGLLYGVSGAIFGLFIVWAILAGIMPSVLELTSLYGSSFRAGGVDINMLLSLLVSGAVLGVTGAAASCYRHIRTVEDV
ncbi:MAG: permease-like cell division protein FtsX [Endozoicomonas sp.]